MVSYPDQDVAACTVARYRTRFCAYLPALFVVYPSLSLMQSFHLLLRPRDLLPGTCPSSTAFFQRIMPFQHHPSSRIHAGFSLVCKRTGSLSLPILMVISIIIVIIIIIIIIIISIIAFLFHFLARLLPHAKTITLTVSHYCWSEFKAMSNIHVWLLWVFTGLSAEVPRGLNFAGGVALWFGRRTGDPVQVSL